MSNYDHTSLKTLTELEHIRMHPAMYIGDVSKPNHLLYEVFDNALDEANAGHATVIGIMIDTKKGTCTISDNGRGIPFQNNSVVTVATKLHSGGKFDKGGEGQAYGIASGLHGIGLVAVTALSDDVSITVYRDDKRAHYEFKDAELTTEDVVDNSEKRPFGTKVTFTPSKNFFESVQFELAPIIERMKLASVHIESLKLVLVVDGEKTIIDCTLDEFFRDTLFGTNGKDTTKIFELRQKVKDEEIHIKFAWDFGSSTAAAKQTGCVNLLSVNDGTHVNMVSLLFRDVFQKIAKKEKLVYQPNDCFVGFRCHTSMSLYNPEYSSQTKEKLATSKTKLTHIFKGMEKKLIELLEVNGDVRLKLLAFFESYRKRMTASKKIIQGGKDVTRFSSAIDSRLRDCSTHSVSNSELFITEGASAAGGLVQCRNPKLHALLSLKGKIPNLATKKKDFLKNKEVVDIINALGTGMEPHFTSNSLRYSKVIISCDADADGAHIQTLLMVLFLKLTPQLIKDGRIYLANMPLYGAVKSKKFYPFYTDEELEKFKEENPTTHIARYKGLGEMNPAELQVCLLDKSTRQLEVVNFPENPDDIYEIMTSAEKKRGLVN